MTFLPHAKVAEPQFPGVISVGLLIYIQLCISSEFCASEEDKRCFVMLLDSGMTPAAFGFLTHQEDSQTLGFLQRVQKLPGLCAELWICALQNRMQ